MTIEVKLGKKYVVLGIKFGLNCFWLFGLDFKPFLGLIFWQYLSFFNVFQFLLTLIFGYRVILVI